jgi:hypothetical protein
MRKNIIALALSLAGAVALDALAAHAACDVSFDNVHTKGFTQASMVRAFQPCPGSPHPSFPNAETEGDVPACTPVLPREYLGGATDYNYGLDGRCLVRLAAKLASDCSSIDGSDGEPLGLPSGPCHVSRMYSKCQGIQTYDGFPIGEDDAGWTLRMTLRASIDDETSGAMTVIDLPVSFAFHEPEDGAMKLDVLTAEQMHDLGVFLPPCTVLQFMNVYIHDPLGYRFAAIGMATAPEL